MIEVRFTAFSSAVLRESFPLRFMSFEFCSSKFVFASWRIFASLRETGRGRGSSRRDAKTR